MGDRCSCFDGWYDWGIDRYLDECCLVVCLMFSCFFILAGAIVCVIVLLDVIPFKNMKFYVNDASLTQFYLTNDDILHYNLAVNISVRNSNKMERVSYTDIRSEINCYGKDLPSVSLPSFSQGTKNTTILHHPVFHGQTSLKLRGSHLEDFNNDQRNGSYSISVYLYFTTQLTFAGGGKGIQSHYIAHCALSRLHLLNSSSTSLNSQTRIGGLFTTKRCKVFPNGDENTY
ncbi:hypothetical protein MKW94_027172 [Papaver nudicaule]|uniref:Late embryogenesis abundant protein LEA-2 subgroup domain-containing protein n=1 Tax=Papaver nudicaule TaxID=74823 RepID=A0AA41W026_PAPNU|nr:hypothetical protein [Papaver nudicaule]